jgi:hypothetical protein
MDVALELLEQSEKVEQPLGHDPETGKPVFVKQGRFGPYVQLGSPEDDEKPKNASLLKGMDPTQIGLQAALKLLSLPDHLRWYVDRLLGPGRRVLRAVAPLTRSLSDDGPVPVPDDGVVDAVERVHGHLAAVHALLQDPSRSSVRLVVNPERLVVAEAERTATTLSLFGYAVDAIIANRVLPDEVRDPYLAGWKASQADHLATIHERFAPLPVLQVPLLGDEPMGVVGLAPIAEAAYASLDERDVLHDGRPVRLDTDGDGHLLRIALPHTSREDVELHRRDAVPVVSGGGTPAIASVADFPVMTEHRAGTYVYNDVMMVSSGAATWDDCAMRVRATVVSRPTPERAVLDAGSKVLTSDQYYVKHFGRLVDYPGAFIASLSEEHAIIDLSQCAERPGIGEVVNVIPNHCCAVTNMVDEVYGVRNGKVEVVWPVAARGKVR